MERTIGPRRRRVGLVGEVLVVLAAVGLLAGCVGPRDPGPPVAADRWMDDEPAGLVTATFVANHHGRSFGGSGLFDSGWAGSFTFDVEGTETEAYCVQRDDWLLSHELHGARSAEAAGIDQAGRAAWIAAHHLEVPTPLDDPDAEAAAVQVAIWSVVGEDETDAFDDVELAWRARELIAASAGQTLEAGPTAFELETEAGTGPDAGRVDVRALANGEGAPDVVVEVTGEGYQEQVRTGPDGRVSVEVPTDVGEVEVTWRTDVAPGTILEPADDEGQAVMLASAVTVERQASVSLTARDL